MNFKPKRHVVVRSETVLLILLLKSKPQHLQIHASMLQIYNKEGMWIKLDKEAMKRFDLKQYDSVWSLAVDKSQIVYLRSDFSINKGKWLLFSS